MDVKQMAFIYYSSCYVLQLSPYLHVLHILVIRSVRLHSSGAEMSAGFVMCRGRLVDLLKLDLAMHLSAGIF
jgi:hypothetical protein